MIEIDNELHIIKSKYTGSSTIEIKEIIDIENKLEEFNNCFEIQIVEDKVILIFK